MGQAKQRGNLEQRKNSAVDLKDSFKFTEVFFGDSEYDQIVKNGVECGVNKNMISIVLKIEFLGVLGIGFVNVKQSRNGELESQLISFFEKSENKNFKQEANKRKRNFGELVNKYVAERAKNARVIISHN